MTDSKKPEDKKSENTTPESKKLDGKEKAKAWKSIGKIGHPHGLKGDFLMSGRTTLLPAHIIDVVVGETAEQGVPSKLTKNDIYKERNLLHLQKVNTRNALEKLQGVTLWIPDDVLENPIDALLGKTVIDSDGVVVGSIKEINCYGASDILEIKNANTRSIDIPFVLDYFDVAAAYESEILRLLVPISTFDDCWY